MVSKKENKNNVSRRKFLALSGAVITGASLPYQTVSRLLPAAEPIIDIHQHTNYKGRTVEQLLTHQRAMGISHTILLPAGSNQNMATTNFGESNGLEGEITPVEVAFRMAKQYPEAFSFGANEVPDLPNPIKKMEKYLKKGGVVIGEQKFNVETDSPEMQRIYQLAQEYEVPVLMHWQHGRFNHGLDRFHKMLGKYPNVDFI